MKKLWAFDLDGSLVNSYTVTKRAYSRAGITFTPEMFATNSSTWVVKPTEEQRAKKAQVLAEILTSEGIETLPLYHFMWQLISNGEAVEIWTGASDATVEAYRSTLDLPEKIVSKLAPAEKVALAKTRRSEGFEVIYFDDSFPVVNLFRNSNIKALKV
jgi:phosphoglycolate phosphatase-like HAD superfamily hydrolase